MLESPLDCKEIKPVNPKWNQPWIFIGRTDAEAEAPKFQPPDVKSQLIRKDPDAERDWRKEKGVTEDEMVGWHHWLNGYEFEQTLGDGEWQGSLAWCSPWGCKELDMTEQQQQSQEGIGEEQQPRDSIACLRNSKMVSMVAVQGGIGRRQRIDKVSKLFKVSLAILRVFFAFCTKRSGKGLES